MISFVVFSLRRAWQGFWRNALMSLAATATMVLMLLLLAGFWIIQTGLLSALDFTESKVQVQVNMNVDTTPAAEAALGEKIKSLPGVAGVTLITREEALARFQQSMKDQGREDRGAIGPWPHGAWRDRPRGASGDGRTRQSHFA